MKSIIIWFILVMCGFVLHGNEKSKIDICKFYGGKKAALCLTFDDGTKDHLSIAAPLLEKYGFRGTFYIVVNRIKDAYTEPQGKYKYMTWAEVKELADRGHEIGNHSMSHYQLVKEKDPEKLLYEIKEPIEILYKKTGYKPVTFCYPGNSRNDEIIKMTLKYHIDSRLKNIQFGGDSERAEKNKERIENLIKNGEEWPVMIHAIEKGYGWDPFDDVAIFEDCLKYLKGRNDVLWVDTFANLAKYRLNRENTEINILKDSPEELVFECKSKNGKTFYDFPLTIALPDAQNPKISQNGKDLKYKIQDQQIIVDILPNAGPVKVIRR